MKIAVQGKIIDTENIYSISEVVAGYNPMSNNPDREFSFEIESFNEKTITISLSCNDGLNEAYGDIGGPPIDREERLKLIHKVEDDNKARIARMRQDIIKIWSKNQSSIPNFDIKKY